MTKTNLEPISIDSVIYHIYPLGALGAPRRNEAEEPAVERLSRLVDWIDHWKELGVTTVFLGPVLESTSHGYDVRSYTTIDRRLGSGDSMKTLVRALHDAGISTMMDAVFNHVGREFPAFVDVQKNGPGSRYVSWFADLKFEGTSPYGDPFVYAGWAGHYNLVKLNLKNPEVRRFLLDAVSFWIDEWDLDGLRLDAADVLEPIFLEELRAFSQQKKSGFWLMGEVVHGDYRDWVSPKRLHSVTNYEAYKGLWSSHNDKNFFEIAYSLRRCFAPGGLYEGLPLSTFVDNHDVERIASQLNDAAHLGSIYALAFTIPGVPTIYYGSETGWLGKKQPHSDDALRPALDPATIRSKAPHPALWESIRRLARLRNETPELRYGDYRQVYLDSQTIAFVRTHAGSSALVVVNCGETKDIEVKASELEGEWIDRLNDAQRVRIDAGGSNLTAYGAWARVLVRP